MNPPANRSQLRFETPADSLAQNPLTQNLGNQRTNSPYVVIGLGTPNGDDQFGWHAIDELLEAELDVPLLKVQNPIDILGWLDTAERVHIVDAAHDMPDADEYLELDFSKEDDRNRIMEVPVNGTHGLDLYSTLMLARALGKSTHLVTLWLGRAEQFEPLTDLSPNTASSLHACIKALKKRLGNA